MGKKFLSSFSLLCMLFFVFIESSQIRDICSADTVSMKYSKKRKHKKQANKNSKCKRRKKKQTADTTIPISNGEGTIEEWAQRIISIKGKDICSSSRTSRIVQDHVKQKMIKALKGVIQYFSFSQRDCECIIRSLMNTQNADSKLKFTVEFKDNNTISKEAKEIIEKTAHIMRITPSIIVTESIESNSVSAFVDRPLASENVLKRYILLALNKTLLQKPLNKGALLHNLTHEYMHIIQQDGEFKLCLHNLILKKTNGTKGYKESLNLVQPLQKLHRAMEAAADRLGHAIIADFDDSFAIEEFLYQNASIDTAANRSTDNTCLFYPSDQKRAKWAIKICNLHLDDYRQSKIERRQKQHVEY